MEEMTVIVTSGAYSDYSVDMILRGPKQSFQAAFDAFLETEMGAPWKDKAEDAGGWAYFGNGKGGRFDEAFRDWLIAERGFEQVDADEWHMGCYSEKPYGLK